MTVTGLSLALVSDDVLGSTAASYDLIVEDYERQTACPPPPVTAFRDAFLRCLPDGARLADLGCGPGRDLHHFRSRGHFPVGVDASQGMVIRARERGLATVVGDLRHPPLATAGFDGIWSSASLLHVPGPDVQPTVAAWNELLVVGGTLALTTSLGDGEAGWEAVPYAPGTQVRDAPQGRWFVHHSRERIEEALVSAGFTPFHAEVLQSHRRWLHLLVRKQG